MIEALDGSFTTSHDLPNLSVREVLDKLQDKQMLAFWWQLADESEKRILLFSVDKLGFRMVTFGGQHRQVTDGDFLPAAAVAMPVGDQVVRNAIQPGREWDAAVRIIVNVVHRPLKDASGDVFRVMRVPRPVVHIIEDTVDVALVEFAKSAIISLRGAR